MPLAHALVTAPGAQPDRWVLFLHGILGSGANWRTFAKHLASEKPEWGAALVDLRLHGESRDLSPPHTISAAAADVVALAKVLPGPVRAIVAHSFGGKVALEHARQTDGAAPHVVVVDATPGIRPEARGSESTRHIVELLTTLPPEFPDRDSFLRFVEERGVSRPIAMWLAMNVRPEPNTRRFVFRIDVPAVKTMLEDYFATDLWSVVEDPPGGLHLHFVVGADSTVVDEIDRERIRRAPRATLDVIEGAGHWVHADKPDALRAIVRERIG
jgi:esterase